MDLNHLDIKEKKRVLLVASTPTFGGVFHRVFDFMDYAMKHSTRYEYYLLLFAANDLACQFLTEQGIPFRTAMEKDAESLRRAVYDWKIDLVHLHNLVGKTLYRKALKSTGVLIVEQERGATWNRASLKCFESIFTHHLVDGFMANCFAGRKILQKRLKIDEEKVHVVYNGLNTSFFDSDSVQAIPEARGKRVILTACRLDTPKGLFSFIQAAPRVLKDFPNAEFWILGDGPLESYLKQETERLGLNEKVRFWGAQEYLANFYRACEVFVLVSNREPFPNAIVEASYFGKPVVGTWVDGMSEVVDHGATGILLPGKLRVRRLGEKSNRVAKWVVDGQTGKIRKPLDVDPGELAEAIVDLLSDPDRAKQMGDAGHAKVMREFNMKVHIDSMEDYYKKIFEQSRR